MKSKDSGILTASLIQRSPSPHDQEGVTRDSIFVYQERCPLEQKRGDDKDNPKVNAHNLFNIFTADIIKQKKIFIR